MLKKKKEGKVKDERGDSDGTMGRGRQKKTAALGDDERDP